MNDRIAKFLFLLGLLAAAFGYGFLSHWMKIFPYQLIHEANIAVNAIIEAGNEKLELKNVDFWDDTGLSSPSYRRISPDSGDETVFILGNERAYADSGHAYLAWLADREGSVLHAWKDPGEIWAPLENRDAIGTAWRSYPVGAHLYPNGDILVSYQGVSVFPVPMGLAKFDRDSNLIWKNSGYYHHWFTVAADGSIFVPDTVIGSSPLQIDDHEKTIVCNQSLFPYESLSVLDSDGNKIREIDLLGAFVASDLTGVINSNTKHPTKIETCDLLHLNDVRILSDRQAGEFPAFSSGDLLLSFRSLNGIGVLDPETERFKWFYVGTMHQQHSPRYNKNNRILVFDNYGGRISRGISRVLSIDVGNHQPEVLFPRDDAGLPERPFFSNTAGHIDIDPTGQRVLASFTHQGLVWEFDIDSGELLWEFVNTHPVDGRPGRISVYTAKYVDQIVFPLNRGRFQ